MTIRLKPTLLALDADVLVADDSGHRLASLQRPLRLEIESAIDQVRADLDYEETSPRVSDTIAQLTELANVGRRFAELLTSLSRIGAAAVYEAGMQHRTPMDRTARAKLVMHISQISRSVEHAAERVRHLHSPIFESGQGSGSAEGRDSELRVIESGFGTPAGLPVLRTPKDKFGVAVLLALVRHRHPLASMKRGQRTALIAFLQSLWVGADLPGERSWDSIGRHRKTIIAWANTRVDIAAHWKAIRERRNHLREISEDHPGEQAETTPSNTNTFGVRDGDDTQGR